MNHRLKPVCWTVAAIALSALTSFLVARAAGRTTSHSHSAATGNEGGTFHDWLHSQLKITAEQESLLAPIEADYGGRRTALLRRIQNGGQGLSAALGENPVEPTGIEAALTEIHSAQGELQRLTIEHFLKMKEHLSPDQSDRLLQWTRESITHDGSR
ncbi:MAG: periplasmic heavy metal sensor [Verrucomicrobiales bacterium]|nr:periplasmic heavy metal sensor [Verrucomicrobiales bacterium]